MHIATKGSFISLLAVAAFSVFAFSIPMAHAAVASCTGSVVNPVVDVTQAVSNDPDSGNVSDWATDTYTKHMQVWLDTDGVTYCGLTTDSGTFVTDGTVSPEHGSLLPGTISGTFNGGARYIISGTFLAGASTWPLTGSVPDNDCGGIGGPACPFNSYSGWISEYFSGESHTFVSWGWTYVTPNNGTWVNAGDNSSQTDTGELGVVVDTNTQIGYPTIQAAVDAASPGDTISVNAGTYNESVLINKSLTLTGNGTVVIAGTSTVPTTNYIVNINSVSGSVTLNGLTIDGGGGSDTTPNSNAFDYGIWVNNSGTSANPVELKNLIVKDIWDTSANGIEVDASSVGGSYALVHDNTISSFDKRGIRFLDSSGKVYDNEVIGDHVDGTTRVQNLINLWGGSTVEVYGNSLHDALSTTSGTWDSPAIFVSSYDGGTNANPSNANIHDNQIYNDDTGVTLGSYYVSGTDGSTATITNNTFHDVHSAINLEKGDVTATVHDNSFGTNVVNGVSSDDGNSGPATKASVDATDNYWGAATGPTDATTNPSGTGATIYDAVSFSPWYTDAAMTTLSSGVNFDDGTNATSTVASEIATTTSTAAGNVSLDIPAGTVVTGPSGWDGSIELPTVVTTTVAPTADSGFTNPTAVLSIEVGSSTAALTFSQPVRLEFAGQTGKSVGWSRNGTFTEITTTCSSDSAAGFPASGTDCKFDDGTNLIVWTEHFTTFTTYTQTAVTTSGGSSPAPVAGNGPIVGGGGGGGGAVALPNNGSTATTGSTGQVLGASAYNFATNLTVGSTGADVTQLQTILIADGYLSISAPTGYFGALTKAAVMKYQTANNLPSTGFVGPLTRAVLNQGTTPTMSDEQRSLLIQSLQQQLQALLAQIQALTASSTSATTTSATSTTQ